MTTTTTPLTVDLGKAEFWQGPYPVWNEARQYGRTARTPKGEAILLDAADFDAIRTDPAFGQLTPGRSPMRRPRR